MVEITGWLDPHDVPPPPTPVPGNVLTLISDVQLEKTIEVLEKACGQSVTVVRRKRRPYLCLMLWTLRVERARRGDPNKV